jgi:hypothetical protein
MVVFNLTRFSRDKTVMPLIRPLLKAFLPFRTR